MDNDSDATVLLDLDGLAVVRVKGRALTRPRGLPRGERGLHLVWHKRRWYCARSGRRS
ncbi:hypothetical protein [Streptomyces sp. PT12]|uniref:hypothetical protein n=1 Tax=Streptomyces sp. PT12 TaxID=1510197 RepID=UPI0015EF1E03|nr:hypothetical protein [Streptomyces sp. PT12]